jgi:glycolate oxidase iron-sulfur subunit
MQTNFTAAQLRDPQIAEANAILQTCVHYGFCTNTCPTYVLTRDENEAPRGRIDLIRAMLEKGESPEPGTVRHLDSCLSCLSCMTTCRGKGRLCASDRPCTSAYRAQLSPPAG